MQYLILQILICLVLAGLLGLLVGWLIWGSLARRLRTDSAEHARQQAKLNELTTKHRELTARHAAMTAEKQTEAAEFAQRNREAQTVISAKEKELEQVIVAHRQCRAELESGASRIVELQGNLSRLRGEMQEREATWKATGTGNLPGDAGNARFAELEKDAARVPVLEAAVAAKSGDSERLAGRVTELEAALAAKHAEAIHTDARSADLTTRISELQPVAERVPALEGEIEKHQKSNAEKEAQIYLLSAKVTELEPVAASAAELKVSHESAIARIAELEPLALQVPDLHATLAAKEVEIASQVRSHADKDARLQFLSAGVNEVAPVAAHVPEADGPITPMEAQPNAARVSELEAQLKAREQEITALRDRVDVLSGETATVSESEPKAMAAAAGSYEVGNHISAQPAAASETAMDKREAEIGHLHSIFETLFKPLDPADIQQRAFEIAKSRSFQNGSPQEDWLTAERQIRNERLRWAREELAARTSFKTADDGTPKD